MLPQYTGGVKAQLASSSAGEKILHGFNMMRSCHLYEDTHPTFFLFRLVITAFFVFRFFTTERGSSNKKSWLKQTLVCEEALANLHQTGLALLNVLVTFQQRILGNTSTRQTSMLSDEINIFMHQSRILFWDVWRTVKCHRLEPEALACSSASELIEFDLKNRANFHMKHYHPTKVPAQVVERLALRLNRSLTLWFTRDP